MKVKSESEVAQSCLTLSDPMDCSLSGSSAHVIFQARVLEWGAIAFSKNSSLQQPKFKKKQKQKQKTLIKKWKKELHRYFSKDKQMASKHTVRGKKSKSYTK